MSDATPPPPDASPAMPAILVALSQEHRALADANTSAPIAEDQLRSFIDKAQRSGASLESPRDRAIASRIMRYWAAEAIRRGTMTPADKPPMLAPYGASAAGTETPSDGTAPPADAPVVQNPEDIERIARSRKLIRLAALAREWRLSGGQKGYLLNGDALTEAQLFVNDDEDIAALVAASEHQKTRGRRWLIAGWALATTVLVVLLTVVFFLWQDAEQARKQAEQARALATLESEKATAASKDATTKAEAADGEVANAKQRERNLNSTVYRLSRRSADLDARLLETSRQLGIARGTDAQQHPVPAEVIPEGLAEGYQPGFLKVEVPLPAPRPEIKTALFNGGQPINFVNYSVILNAARRMALFTASNYDQSAVVFTSPQSIAPYPDSAIPANVQPDPDWFTQKEIESGNLVTGSEIAWGDGFTGKEPDPASLLAYSAVNLYPNMVPQFDTFHQGLWSGLERYAAYLFNPGVDRISIFSGPVLSDDDPVVNGVKLPRSYWKILVSTTLNAQSDLLVEAYIVPQMDSVTGEKTPLDTLFDKPEQRSHFRVSVRDIERLTGLDFSERVRDAGQLLMPSNITVLQQRPPSAGQTLAARVPSLDAPEPATRQATTQSIIAALRDGGITAETDQRPVIQAMLALARRDSFVKLTPDARISLIQALLAVPKNVWDRPDFRDLKAGARRAVGDIDSDIASGTLEPIPQLETLKQRLDWALANGRTVYLQFAGMTRAAALDIQKNLKALGWTLPGIERTSDAAGVNEVRFAPPDDAAGLLLVEDLKALGRNAVQPKPTTNVVAGRPEIWVSD